MAVKEISLSHPGLVVTFYSYKGGVGRSMALANVALLLAKAGKRVLCIDWDLEAPGLSRYFECLEPVAPTKSGGLLDILEESEVGRLSPWVERVGSFAKEKNLHLLNSGHTEADYSERLGRFSWSDFFATKDGGGIIESLRKEWRLSYDFILIDSRTGLTDASGICTIQLPDILILLFAANEQNVDGSQRVAKAIRRGRRKLRYDRKFLPIVPVLSRFDSNEESKQSEKWLSRIANVFEPYFRDWTPIGIEASQMLEWIRLPYVPRYSFGESLAVVEQGTDGPQLLGFYYNIVANLLLRGFSKVRDTLVEAGFSKATLEPFLPNDAIVRSKMREAPTYARKEAENISQHAAEYPAAVLESLERLAEHSESLQRQNDAEEILRRAVVLVKDPETSQPEELARVLGKHADILEKMGRIKEASVRHREALASVRDIFKSSPGCVVSPMTCYAEFLSRNDRIKEAIAQYQEAILCAENAFEGDPRRLALPIVSYAMFLEKIKRKAEAIDQLRRVLKYYQVIHALDAHPSEDPTIESTLTKLRELLIDTERFEEAKEVAELALKRLSSRPNPDGGALSDALDSLAWILEHLGINTEAVEKCRESLALKLSDAERDQITIATAYSRLADPLTTLAHFEEAEELYKKALNINEQELGADDPNTADICASLADLLSKKRMHNDAEEHMRRAFSIRERVYDADDKEMGLSHSHLGLILCEAGKYPDAEFHHQQALKIDQKVYGLQHSEVGFDMVSLARALSQQGMTALAQPHWDKGLPILEKRWKPGHEQLARVHHHHAQHLARIGQIATACREIDRSVVEFEKALGRAHPDTIEAMKTQGQLKRQLELSLGR